MQGKKILDWFAAKHDLNEVGKITEQNFSIPLNELFELPFFVIGAYQSLFFGTPDSTCYKNVMIRKYLHLLFESVIPETYKRIRLDDIMMYLRTEVILYNDAQLRGTAPYFLMVEVYNDAEGDFVRRRATSLAEIILIETDIQTYKQMRPYNFDQFEITRRVPYFVLFDVLPSNKKSAMELCNRDFEIYLDFFRTSLKMLFPAQFYRSLFYQQNLPKNIILSSTEEFADVKTEDVQITETSDRRIAFPIARYPNYPRSWPTSHALNLFIFMVEGMIRPERNKFIFVDRSAWLLNHIEYGSINPKHSPGNDIALSPYHRKRNDSSGWPLLVLRTAALFHHYNKLYVLGVLLNELSPPTDDLFALVLRDLEPYSRSERFFFLSNTIALRFVLPAGSVLAAGSEGEDEDMVNEWSVSSEEDEEIAEQQPAASLFKFLYDEEYNAKMTPFASIVEGKLWIGFYAEKKVYVREITFVGGVRDALKRRVGKFKSELRGLQEHSFHYKSDTPQPKEELIINVEPPLKTLRLNRDDAIEKIGETTIESKWDYY